jgi:ATPase subunit of ABC transporter with duplicated ATPase domains
MEEEGFTRRRNVADAVAKKEKKAMEFIAKQQAMSNKKGRDDNKQKQAKERKTKLGRIGLYAENGHKFHLLTSGNSKTGGANRAQHISGNYRSSNGQESALVSNTVKAFGLDKQRLNFNFPAAEPLGGSSSAGENMTLLSMESCAFGYTAEKQVLKELTLAIDRGSRVAVVGRNGAGKSTLIKLLVGALQLEAGHNAKHNKDGTYYRHPNCRVAYIAQHHIEQLALYLGKTAVQVGRTQV